MFKTVKLSMRLAVFSVVMFVGVVGALAVPLIMALQDEMEAVLIAQQERSVAFVARYLNDAGTMRLDYLRRVADGVPEQALDDPAAMRRYLAAQHGAVEFFNFGLYAINPAGQGIADYPELSGRGNADFNHLEYFHEVMEKGRPAIGKPRIGRFSGKPVVSLAVPVRDSAGRLRAVLCGALSIVGNQVFGILTDSRQGGHNGYYLVSPRDRLVIAATNPAMELTALPANDKQPLLDRYLRGYEGSGRAMDAHGVEQLVSGSYIPTSGWFVVSVLPTAEAFAPVRGTVWRVAIAALVASLLFAPAMVWLMRREFSPLERSAQFMRRLASRGNMLGDIPEDGRDEVLAMQRSFNELQRHIRQQAEEADTERRLLDTLAARVPGILLLFQLFPDGTGCFQYRSRSGLCPSEPDRALVRQRLTLDELLGYVVVDGRTAFIDAIHASARDQLPLSIDYQVVVGDGAIRWRHLDATPEAKEDGSTLWYGYVSDITEQHSYAEQIEHLAYYDALTELPNRRLLADRLQQALASGSRLERLTVVCYMDLDGFKPVNDRYGHEAGDAVLVETARRLEGAVRSNDTVARIGGDEFVILITDLTSYEEGEQVLARVVNGIAVPYRLPTGKTCHLTASIGITYAPQDGSDPDTLLRHADQAMFLAKQQGRNGFHFFDPTQDQRARAEIEIRRAVRQAMEDGAMELFWQPKVDMSTGAVIGAEALVRWRQPDGSVCLPGAFLPALEGDELIVELGDYVLEAALSQLESWNAEGFVVHAAINVAARQLHDPAFPQRLAAALTAHPEVSASQLELEILETSALNDLELAAIAITACQNLGVGFAIDDFGTGYSSMTYFRRLAADTVKIDQSFVRAMLNDPADREIVAGILGMTRAFGRRAVAEGVETIAHGEMLLSLGCRYAQGYAIAAPMPAGEFAGWARDFKAHPLWTQNAEATADPVI